MFVLFEPCLHEHKLKDNKYDCDIKQDLKPVWQTGSNKYVIEYLNLVVYPVYGEPDESKPGN